MMTPPAVYLVCGAVAYYLEDENESTLFGAPLDADSDRVLWDEGGDIFEADGAAPYLQVLVALLRAAAVTDRALVALY